MILASISIKKPFWGSSLAASEERMGRFVEKKRQSLSRKASKEISEEKWSSDRLRFQRRPPWVPLQPRFNHINSFPWEVPWRGRWAQIHMEVVIINVKWWLFPVINGDSLCSVVILSIQWWLSMLMVITCIQWWFSALSGDSKCLMVIFSVQW